FDERSLADPDPVVLSTAGQAGKNTVAIRTSGAGTVYWSATAASYDRAGALEQSGARKLALARRYFTLQPVRSGARLLYRERPLDGPVAPGDVLLVRLTAAGSTDWRYLMIEDPIPAGTEPIQLMDLYPLERRGASFDPARREYRDDRVVLFQESFTGGRYDYQYLLKVTTPGVFGAMPARIAPMYVPGAQASTATQTLTVQAANAGGQGAQR
ncbi:MAG: hypothetical protein H6Q10_3345, partial [Acidobacteria bacterium]|nr:hypothetical protein [Acidobacteriota bacterium]